VNIDLDRLAHAKIQGPGVTLAYMADNKAHVSLTLLFPPPQNLIQGLESTSRGSTALSFTRFDG
jgi:hypothetical protein